MARGLVPIAPHTTALNSLPDGLVRPLNRVAPAQNVMAHRGASFVRLATTIVAPLDAIVGRAKSIVRYPRSTDSPIRW